MTYKECYNLWLSSDAVDEKTKAELEAISTDEKEIEDRFYKDLEFGTAEKPHRDLRIISCLISLKERIWGLQSLMTQE